MQQQQQGVGVVLNEGRQQFYATNGATAANGEVPAPACAGKMFVAPLVACPCAYDVSLRMKVAQVRIGPRQSCQAAVCIDSAAAVHVRVHCQTCACACEAMPLQRCDCLRSEVCSRWRRTCTTWRCVCNAVRCRATNTVTLCA